MNRIFRCVFFLLILVSQSSVADVVLSGSMNIGDNNPNDTLNPVSFLNSAYDPVNPIHFSLTQSTTISEIKLNNGAGASYPLSFIVWDSRGQVVISAKQSSTKNLYSVSGPWALPAGDYSIAIWGQCIVQYGLIFYEKYQYDARCGSSSWLGLLYSSEWDDVSFSGITLVGASSTSFNFIQRQHIGDNSGDLSRWFPSNPSGTSVTYQFSLSSGYNLNKLAIYRLADWSSSATKNSRITIKKTTGNTTVVLKSYDFTKNGDDSWLPGLSLSAGNYSIVISTDDYYNYDADDIAWDDVIVSLSPISGINHYEIRYPSSQITCEPASVTINACTNSDTSGCTLDTTAASTVALSAPSSSGFTNPITLTNGSASIALNHYSADSVKLGLTNSSAYTCYKGSVIDSTCQLPFVSSAFSFNIPTFYAGSNSGNATLKALQASATNPAVCTTLFANQTQNISFSSQYVLPATGSKNPVLNGTAISSNTSIPLTFNNSGVANIALSYNDTGVLGINAQYSKTDTTAGTLNISGSDNVAVLPQQIQLTAVGQTACTGTSDAAYANCSKYKTVGESFTLSAQAGYPSGTSFVSTNNFTPESSVKPLLQHKLVAPSLGTLPALAQTMLTFSGGKATASISESDVGVYQYGASDFVPYPSYQDEWPQKTVPLSWSAEVGRFVPAQLKATLVANGSLTTDTCVAANQVSATLGYTGQSLRFATAPMLSVAALGSDGATEMKNYQGYFAKVTSTDAGSSGNFVAAMFPKNSANTLTSSASWSAGSWTTPGSAYHPVYTFSANNQFTFSKNSTPVSPFETSLVVSTLTDSDGVAATSSLPLTFNPLAPDSSAFKIYFGRLALDNANGSESSVLTMPFYMQYWNGSAYALNTSDNCSSLSTGYLQMNGAASWNGVKLRTGSTTTATATTAATLSPAVVTQGSGAIQFSAPNASGWVDVAAGSSLPLWMQDLAQTSGLNPARASFGYYRGNDRLIYRREVFGN